MDFRIGLSGFQHWGHGLLRGRRAVMRPLFTSAALLLLIAQVPPAKLALAQTAEEEACGNAPSAASLKACTALIAKGGDDVNLARTYFNRGISRQDKGQIELAIKDYTAAIKLNPRYSAPYNNRAGLYLRLGKKKLALSDFDRSIDNDPDNFYALNSRGRYYLADENKPERAIDDFNRAIAVNPQFALAYANRGFAYEKLGDRAKAIADFEKAIALGVTKQQEWRLNKSLRKLKK